MEAQRKRWLPLCGELGQAWKLPLTTLNNRYLRDSIHFLKSPEKVCMGGGEKNSKLAQHSFQEHIQAFDENLCFKIQSLGEREDCWHSDCSPVGMKSWGTPESLV